MRSLIWITHGRRFASQLQDEESVYWEAYVEQAEIIIGHHISPLKIHEFVTLWLQTAEGEDWLINSGPYVTREYYEQMAEDEKAANRYSVAGDIPAHYEDVLEYIKDALYRQAMEHSNHRIRAYIDRGE